MTERERDEAFEVNPEGRVVRNPDETIGAIPGRAPVPDISGGPGEGTGWDAWRAEHETGDEAANTAKAKAGAAKEKRGKRG